MALPKCWYSFGAGSYFSAFSKGLSAFSKCGVAVQGDLKEAAVLWQGAVFTPVAWSEV